MCLNRLGGFDLILDKNGIGEGWKVFCVKRKKLYGELARTKKVRPYGKWLKEDCFRPRKKKEKYWLGSIYYEHGWHIFLTRKGAETWSEASDDTSVVKVKFRHSVQHGHILGNKVVVAKEIFIPK